MDIRELNALAVRGLEQMFDAEKQLFCFRRKRSWQGVIREGLSRRYTIISLLGLRQLETRGYWPAVEVKGAMDALLHNTQWINNIGDLGLLLWLCALVAPERLKEIYAQLAVEGALKRYRDARAGRTMELAWFLTGLSHGTLACREALRDIRGVAFKTYLRLTQNQGARGLFGHAARNATLIGALRGRIGSFADQVYPIYALTRFAQAFDFKEALSRAKLCGETICRLQGPSGQWWWHYDSVTGKVTGRYPVYHVHQDGMAPMALFALGEATRSDFGPSIYRGIRWMVGGNELHCDLRDAAENVIWRCIYHKRYRFRFSKVLQMLRFNKDCDSPNDLTIKFECRPYELGWLLYAFAGRSRI